ERRPAPPAGRREREAGRAPGPEGEPGPRARRIALEDRRRAIADIADRLASRTGEIEALAERLRTRRRLQSEAAREAGRKLDGLRAQRSQAEKELTELRDRAGKLEIEEAEIRLRL